MPELHEDWCPGKVHADCCGKACECWGRYVAALASIEAACDAEDKAQINRTLPQSGWLTTRRIRQLVAEQLDGPETRA